MVDKKEDDSKKGLAFGQAHKAPTPLAPEPGKKPDPAKVSGLPRDAVEPIAERASGEAGRKNQVEENPHKTEPKDGQPKEREFSGDVRRPGSPNVI